MRQQTTAREAESDNRPGHAGHTLPAHLPRSPQPGSPGSPGPPRPHPPPRRLPRRRRRGPDRQRDRRQRRPPLRQPGQSFTIRCQASPGHLRIEVEDLGGPWHARPAHGLTRHLHRLRRRRPPRRPATRLHPHRDPQARRHLRHPRPATRHPVRHLRRPAPARIRLPDLPSRTPARPRPPRTARSPGGQVSTRVDGATVTVTVSAYATLSARTVHMTLTSREGPVPGIWQYNLNDGTDNRAGRGRIAGKTDHLDVLRYAAGICAPATSPAPSNAASSSSSPPPARPEPGSRIIATAPAVVMTASPHGLARHDRAPVDHGTIVTTRVLADARCT
jgi:hypothetical protein